MRKLLLLLPAALPCLAAITNIQATGATPREVILRYVAPAPAACTMEVSESPAYVPLVNDVNTALFSGSNSDFRNGVQGKERTFIVGAAGTGINYAPYAANGVKTSRALQANTVHYYRLTCGADVATGTFQTANIATGDTFAAVTAPIDPAHIGDTAWPFIPWSGTGGVIDPITGVFSQPFRAMNERHAGADDPGVVGFSSVYDDSGNWTNKSNILADDSSLASVTTNDSIRFYTTVQQVLSTTNLVGLTLHVHGFVSNSSMRPEACLSIDGATCYGPWISVNGLPVGTLGAEVTAGDPSGGATPAMLSNWLNPNQAVPSQFDTSARTGLADNTGSTLYLRAYGSGRGSFDYRWTPGTHIIYDGIDYTVASVQSGSQLTLSSAPPNKVSKAWTAANFGFMIRRGSVAGTLAIDSVRFNYNLYATFQTNGGSGGGKQCTNKRFPEGWRIGGPAGSTLNAATNTAPIQLTFTSDMDFVTGDVIKVLDVPGNIAANGTWTVTGTGARTITLNGSDGTASGTYPSDVNYIASDLGSGIAWRVNATTGFLCSVTDGSSSAVLYWINPDTTPADIRYLGIGYTYIRGSSGVPGIGVLDEADVIPVVYNVYTINGKQELFRGRYKGNQQFGMFRSIGTDTSGAGPNSDIWAWISQTPSPSTLTDKFTAFDPTSTEQFFGINGAPKPGLLSLFGRAGGIQNSMGWLGIYDAVNNQVKALMNSWKNSNARFCGIHTPLPWPGADFYSFVPYELGGSDGGVQADWKGPYRLFPTSGALSATTSDCANQLAAIGASNPLNVTGNQCTTVTVTNTIPTTPSNFVPANDTRFNEGIRVGDQFGINTASGGPGGIGNYDNERMTLMGYSGTTLVFQRTAPIAHGSGWNVNEFCSVVPLWWDYTSAPHGQTGTDPYSQGINGIFNDPPFVEESHYFTRNGLSVADSVGAALFTSLTPPFTCSNTAGASAPYSYRNYPWPNHVTAPTSAYGCVQGNPEFDGHTGNGNGEYLEKHPSPIDNQAINSSFLDARPYQAIPQWQQTVTKIGTYVYKVTNFGEFQAFDEKRNKLYITIGKRTAYDVSAAGFTLPDNTAYNYTYCLVHVNGECWASSLPGEVYVNAPYVSVVPLGWGFNPGEYRCNVKGELWSDLQLNDICVAVQSPYAEYAVQYSASHDPYNTGARKLTAGLNMPRTSNNLWTVPPMPNGDWLISWGGLINEGARYLSSLVKVPPYPGPQRGINRGSWIPVPVKLAGVPAGTNNVVVEFGYDPGFHCTTRQETCVANAAGIAPAVYYYATSDTYAGLSCASGCTPVIPALAQRVMWYRVKYRDAGNSVIKTGDVQTLATP